MNILYKYDLIKIYYQSLIINNIFLSIINDPIIYYKANLILYFIIILLFFIINTYLY